MVKVLASSFLLCIAAAAAIAQVGGGGPQPACVTDFYVPGGACSNWTDVTQPEVCPDEVISSDGCKDTQQSSSGYKNRSGYDANCTMRVRTWNSVTEECTATLMPPAAFRCHEASGGACGPGCGAC